MKQTIKLRESELKRMISETVKRVLRESSNNINHLCAGNDIEPTDLEEMCRYLRSCGFKLVDQEAAGGATEGGTRMLTYFEMSSTSVVLCWSDKTRKVIRYNIYINKH